MKKISSFMILLLLLSALSGCGNAQQAQVAAITLPVYEFTARICQDTDIQVTRLVTENVSCLHDYTLQVSQMRKIEGAQVVVRSGAGLEDFLAGALDSAKTVIDASQGIALLCPEDAHNHDHDHSHDHGAEDPHIWLSPANAKVMAQNICAGLSAAFPEQADRFDANLQRLFGDLDALERYGEENLKQLTCRELITFHDGFAYLADAYDLHILRAVEEESGSEASASELIELIQMVEAHDLPAIFIEKNGSVSAASVITAETGVKQFSLDMAMSGDSYFDAMYHNIGTLKEALG